MGKEYRIIKPVRVGDIVRASDGTSWHVFIASASGYVYENSEIRQVGRGLMSADPTVYLAEIGQEDKEEVTDDLSSMIPPGQYQAVLVESKLERSLHSKYLITVGPQKYETVWHYSVPEPVEICVRHVRFEKTIVPRITAIVPYNYSDD